MVVSTHIQQSEKDPNHSIPSYVSQKVVAIMLYSKHPNNITVSVNIIVTDLDVN